MALVPFRRGPTPWPVEAQKLQQAVHPSKGIWGRDSDVQSSDEEDSSDEDGHVSQSSDAPSRSRHRLRNAVVALNPARAHGPARAGGGYTATGTAFTEAAGIASAAAKQQQLQQQQHELAAAAMGPLLRGLAGSGEAACTGASIAFAVAAAAAAHGRVPDALLGIVSPFRAQMDEIKVLGRGGFGSVSLVRSKLDHRLMAVKTVRFNSTLPPWSPPEALEAAHHKLLREVRALAALPDSPYVLKYYWGWLEPDWKRVGAALARAPGFPELLEQAQVQVGHAKGGRQKASAKGRGARGTQAAGARVPSHLLLLPPAAAPGRHTTSSRSNSRSSSSSGCGNSGSSSSMQISSSCRNSRTHIRRTRQAGRGQPAGCFIQELPCGETPSSRPRARVVSARPAVPHSVTRVASTSQSVHMPVTGSRVTTAPMPIIDMPYSSSPSTSLPSSHISSLTPSLARHTHVVIELASSPSADALPSTSGLGRAATATGAAAAGASDQGSRQWMPAAKESDTRATGSSSSSSDSSSTSWDGSSKAGSRSGSSSSGGSSDGSENESGSSDLVDEGTRDVEVTATHNSAFTFGDVTQSITSPSNIPTPAHLNKGHRYTNGHTAANYMSADASQEVTRSRSGVEPVSGSDLGTSSSEEDEQEVTQLTNGVTHSSSRSSGADALAIMLPPRLALATVPTQPVPHTQHHYHHHHHRHRQQNEHHHHHHYHSKRAGMPTGQAVDTSQGKHGVTGAPKRGDAAGAETGVCGLAGLTGVTRWPYVLYIAMELVTGLTLDVWLKQRAEMLACQDSSMATQGSSSLGSSRATAPSTTPGLGVDPSRTSSSGSSSVFGATAATAGSTAVHTQGLHMGPGGGGLLGPTERDIFRQLVLGLSHVHATGILHRDVKPANIFVTPMTTAVAHPLGGWWMPGAASVQVKLGDFGLSTRMPMDGAAAAHGDGPAQGVTISSVSSSNSIPVDRTGAAAAPEAGASSSDAAVVGSADDCQQLQQHQQTLTLAGRVTSIHTVDSSDTGAGSIGNSTASAGLVSRTGDQHPVVGVGIKYEKAGAEAHGTTRATVQPQQPAAGMQLPHAASRTASTSIHTSGVGTPSYCAPEQMSKDGVYGPAVDVFPLGLILMELACAFNTGMERATAMRDARMGMLPPAMVTQSPREAALAARLLSPNPDERPSALQLLAVLQLLWGPVASEAGTQAAGPTPSQHAASMHSHGPQPPHRPSYPMAHQGRASNTSMSSAQLPMLLPPTATAGGIQGGIGDGASAMTFVVPSQPLGEVQVVEVSTAEGYGTHDTPAQADKTMSSSQPLPHVTATAAPLNNAHKQQAVPAAAWPGFDSLGQGVGMQGAAEPTVARVTSVECVMCEVCDVGTQTPGESDACSSLPAAQYEYEGRQYTGEQLLQLLRERDAELCALRQSQ